MSNLTKRIELLANIAIVVVAVILAVVLVQRYLLPNSRTDGAAERAQVKPGMKLSLPGVDWGKSDQTLLMVLSTTCHFCTESAPFYQRLAREKSGRGDVRLVAVLPQEVGEAQKYLNEHGISVDEVKQASLTSVSVRGTPTLIMVDRNGSVIEAWEGKLPGDKETEVLNRLRRERAGNQRESFFGSSETSALVLSQTANPSPFTSQK